jgi:hypothetical protein
MQSQRKERKELAPALKLPAPPCPAPASDDRGAIAIYVALMMPFLVGLALLVVDGGRLFNLDTSLQNNVDALALAGGAELDRRPDAHVRACRAMRNLISNSQLFVTSNSQLDVACDSNGNPTMGSDVGWCWLKSLPADHCKIDLTDSCQKNSTTPGSDCAYDLSTSAETTFYMQVRSRVQAAGFSTVMPVAIVGGQAPASVRRSAVAGMARVVCQPTPLMICNPWEALGIDTVAELRTKIGSITTAREYGGGQAAIGPGEFGLLDPSEVFDTCNNSGGIVDTLTWQLAGGAAAYCKVQNGLCPKTGVIAKLDNAVNTRFDIYRAMNSYLSQNAAALAPAARTFWSDAGRYQEYCAKTSVKEVDASQIWYSRSDSWDRVAYFAKYTGAFPSLNSATATVTIGGQQKQLGALTRYQTYLWETEQAKIGMSATVPFTYGRPAAKTCFAVTAANGSTILNQAGFFDQRVKRRDIYGAVANCLEIKTAIDAGAPYSLNGASTSLPLPSLAVAKFFVTEPVNRTIGTTFTTGGSEGGAGAWPATCPAAQHPNRFWFDLAGNLVAGQTYFLRATNNVAVDATLPSDQSPTLAALAAAFNQVAADDGMSSHFQFCGDASTGRLFLATDLGTNKSAITLGLSVPGANKRIFLELVDVFAADNGGDVSRDIVRLFR